MDQKAHFMHTFLLRTSSLLLRTSKFYYALQNFTTHFKILLRTSRFNYALQDFTTHFQFFTTHFQEVCYALPVFYYALQASYFTLLFFYFALPAFSWTLSKVNDSLVGKTERAFWSSLYFVHPAKAPFLLNKKRSDQKFRKWRQSLKLRCVVCLQV